MIIDAKNLIAGRIGTYVAKRAILGEEMTVVNSEQAIMTGSKKVVLAKYQSLDNKGEPFHGPFLPKTPDRFLKRIIKGMIPYKQGKGRDAMARVKCYTGIPSELKGKDFKTLDNANISKVQNLKYLTIKEVCYLVKQR